MKFLSAKNHRGVTLVEICIALLLLSLGLVSILALFPKALHSTSQVMEITMASSVARSAMAQLIIDALDGDIDDTGGDSDLAWDSDYDGGGADGDGWWPGPAPADVSFAGTVKSVARNGDDSEVTVSDIGPAGKWVITGGGSNDIACHFLLINSGRARSRLYPISNIAFDVTLDYEKLTLDGAAGDPLDVAAHGVSPGDSFVLIGPACVGPVPAVTAGQTLYSWIAVICHNSWRSSIDSGTATGGSGTTLTDDDKNWPLNSYNNRTIFISSGPGSSQWRTISSNTVDTLTVSAAWGVNPDDTSQYIIYEGVSGIHRAMIFVYGRDFGGGNISDIRKYKPSHYFAAAISEAGAAP